jgi:hypothetical protein
MPRNADRPLSADEQRFVRHYVRERDPEKAAKKARLKMDQGMQFYKRAHVREEIDRRLRLIELEQAKLDAQDIDRRIELTDDFLNEHLRATIELDATKHGNIKLKALSLGYVLRSRIRQGNTEALIRPADTANTTVNFYQSVFERMRGEGGEGGPPSAAPAAPPPVPVAATAPAAAPTKPASGGTKRQVVVRAY